MASDLSLAVSWDLRTCEEVSLLENQRIWRIQTLHFSWAVLPPPAPRLSCKPTADSGEELFGPGGESSSLSWTSSKDGMVAHLSSDLCKCPSLAQRRSHGHQDLWLIWSGPLVSPWLILFPCCLCPFKCSHWLRWFLLKQAGPACADAAVTAVPHPCPSTPLNTLTWQASPSCHLTENHSDNFYPHRQPFQDLFPTQLFLFPQHLRFSNIIYNLYIAIICFSTH